jgi:hypothetical protein
MTNSGGAYGTLLNGATHYIFLSDAEQTAARMRAFLEALRTPR